jgi:hypothetical protein
MNRTRPQVTGGSRRVRVHPARSAATITDSRQDATVRVVAMYAWSFLDWWRRCGGRGGDADFGLVLAPFATGALAAGARPLLARDGRSGSGASVIARLVVMVTVRRSSFPV